MRMAATVPAIFLIAACTSYESHYEKTVYHLEPVYCYQTIGTVDCHRQPDARDADRLVNYYGPAPSKYDPPDPPRLNKLQPPPEGAGYWRDPEPIPGPPQQSEEESEEESEEAEGEEEEGESAAGEGEDGGEQEGELQEAAPRSRAPLPASPPDPAPADRPARPAAELPTET